MKKTLLLLHVLQSQISHPFNSVGGRAQFDVVNSEVLYKMCLRVTALPPGDADIISSAERKVLQTISRVFLRLPLFTSESRKMKKVIKPSAESPMRA